MMMSTHRRGLILMLSPATIHLLDLLQNGVTAEEDLTRRTAVRLDLDPGYVLGVLQDLVVNGYVECEGSSAYRALGDDLVAREQAAARQHLLGLRLEGDHAQADLLELFLDAAWDARSADLDRKEHARLLIRSTEGKRFAELMESRTVGEPFALLRLRRRAG